MNRHYHISNLTITTSKKLGSWVLVIFFAPEDLLSTYYPKCDNWLLKSRATPKSTSIYRLSFRDVRFTRFIARTEILNSSEIQDQCWLSSNFCSRSFAKMCVQHLQDIWFHNPNLFDCSEKFTNLVLLQVLTLSRLK